MIYNRKKTKNKKQAVILMGIIMLIFSTKNVYAGSSDFLVGYHWIKSLLGINISVELGSEANASNKQVEENKYLEESGEQNENSIIIANESPKNIFDKFPCKQGQALYNNGEDLECININTFASQNIELISNQSPEDTKIITIDNTVSGYEAYSSAYVVEPIKGIQSNNECFESTTYKDQSYKMISDCNCLQQIGKNNELLEDRYILNNNIECKGINFNPIGDVKNPFNGVLEGQKYSILNLEVAAGDSYGGLFSGIGEMGVVKNILFEDADVYILGQYGGVVAGDNNGLIENIGVLDSSVETTIGVAGGIVGANNAIIQNVFFAGKVTSSDSSTFLVGGIAGANNGEHDFNGVIRDSYAIATVYGNHSSGGLVGHNSSEIYNSLFAGPVIKTHQNTGGAFIGSSNSIRPNQNNYWVNHTNNQRPVGIGFNEHNQEGPIEMNSIIEFQNPQNEPVKSWDSSIWDIREGEFPVLK